MTTTTTAQATGTDESYAALELLISDRVARHSGPLFTTKVDPKEVWGTFLHSLPAEVRQHYNCHSCRQFVERFGGLVKISETGQALPLVWWNPTSVPEFFKGAVWKCYELVVGAGISGVFYSSAPMWGTPRTPDPKANRVWTHLHGRPAEIFKAPIVTAEQAMAEKLEEHGMLLRALDDYPAPLVAEALRVLRSDALSRSEKALAVAEWFADLHEKVGTRPRSSTALWLAVATAPVGFAHVRTTVISTLLDDVKEGLPFVTIKRRWDEKLNPLAYQRPQAPPKAGAIDVAEKLVEKLGVERSLERRFARLTDVPDYARLWAPRAPEEPAQTGGTFGHLRSIRREPAVKRVALPPGKMSWAKFRLTVLPLANKLEVELPARGPYFALTAPTHADAPNVFQWDNAIGWYFHGDEHRRGGGLRSRWNLGLKQWGDVTLVSLSPPHWSLATAFAHHAVKALFFVEGQRDLDQKGSGLGLFPEFFRSEFHGIRAVVEAHSRSKSLSGFDESDACGVAFQSSGAPTVTVRVDGSDVYILDRWD